MKILLISDYAHPFGGAERQLFRLREMLRQRGHDARLLTSSAGGVDGADYTCFGTLGRFRTLLQSANPAAALRLRAVLEEFRPDVVNVTIFLTQLSPLILPALADVPSVYHAVWYRAVCPKGTKMLPDRTPCRTPAGLACYRQGCLPLRDWMPLMAQMRLWRAWRNVFDRIVANSDATRAMLVEGGIAPVVVIPNGVPVAPARPPLAGPPLAVFAGRLVPEKGTDVLIRAFASALRAIPDAQLLIAGEGPERARLESLAASLSVGHRITFEGNVPRHALEARLEEAWVQAVPSIWAEPFGLVAAEASMRGTAVIAAAVGGLPEVVEHGRTGLLVPPDDVDALADALRRVLGDRTYAEALGAAGRDRALAEFSDEIYADRFEQLYREIL